MLAIGVDVATMLATGFIITGVACVIARALRMDESQALVCISSVLYTSLVYIIVYVIMAMVLDKLV